MTSTSSVARGLRACLAAAFFVLAPVGVAQTTKPAGGAATPPAGATTQPAPDPSAALAAAKYVTIDIRGVIGLDVTADIVGLALKQAPTRGAHYVVLYFDTPGGGVEEMDRIINVISAHPEFAYIARVRRALSAGAIISMLCPTVVMDSGGSVGGAVPFQVVAGVPLDVEAKFKSIFEATGRSAAEHGGHDPLLVPAMANADFKLGMIRKDGKPVLLDLAKKNPADKTLKILKERGAILTLTAQEATDIGYSVGVAHSDTDFVTLCNVPGLSDAGSLRSFMEAKARESRRSLALKTPEVQKMDTELVSIAEQLRSLPGEISVIEREKKDVMKNARTESMRRYQEGEYNKKLGKLRQKMDKLTAQRATLTKQRDARVEAVVNAVPTAPK